MISSNQTATTLCWVVGKENQNQTFIATADCDGIGNMRTYDMIFLIGIIFTSMSLLISFYVEKIGKNNYVCKFQSIIEWQMPNIEKIFSIKMNFFFSFHLYCAFACRRFAWFVFDLCFFTRLCDKYRDNDDSHDSISQLLTLCSNIECIIGWHVPDQHKVSWDIETNINDDRTLHIQ